ncbi:hypothetical protein [Rhabdothermincola salaria]|uniref:hypothetical protein n=1 Tax=Rhabdothermincola salaria TaxID=2903142 RepID=UPI001E287CAE|nr:hypothetical protein [Rhabdothermincola salaria]MCD9622724.1 hypothetical protein [Rhabdothermincola salaria]
MTSRIFDIPGLPAPARRALVRNGLTSFEAVAACDERDLAVLHGVGQRTIEVLRRALAEQGRGFGDPTPPTR